MISLKKAFALALTTVLSMGILSSCGGANTPKEGLNRIDNPQYNGSDEVRIVDEESNSGSNHDDCYEEWTFDEAAAHSTDIVEAEFTGTESYNDASEASDSVRLAWTYEEAAAHSTDIVEAEFSGTESYNDAEEAELVFKVVRNYKGGAETGAMVYVVPYDRYYSDKVYEEGRTYLLLLQRFSSVYYEHDTYYVLDEQVISSSDAGWDSAVAAVKAIPLEADKTPTYSIEKFTTSEDISEIIDFSDNIFVVSIDSIFAESSVYPTTVYNCSVTGTVRGMPENNGDIRITLFNDTVEVGGEYVVFLVDSNGLSIYTLAAKDGVYSVDNASNMTEINDLLNEVQEYSSAAQISVDSDTVSDDEDIITDSPLPD